MFELAIIGAQAVTGIRLVRQGFPVPFLFVLHAEIFFEHLLDVGADHPHGLVAGRFFGVGGIGAGEIGRIQFHAQARAGELGKSTRAIVVIQEAVDREVDLVFEHLHDPDLAIGAFQDLSWR